MANFKREGGYIKLHEVILASEAYRDLKPSTRILLQEFQKIYRPDRNGRLSISTKNAMNLLNVSEPTVLKAFDALQSHGFLVQTKEAVWHNNKAREFRLTFEPINGREPTDEWKMWSPDKPFPVPAGRRKKKIPTQKMRVI